MPGAARIGDRETGTCDLGLPDCPHTRNGTNTEASPNVLINGRGAHRRGDTGPCNCPHGGVFATTGGSGTVFINGKAAVRIGDATTCGSCGQGGSHTTGSGNVFIGG
ncbi:PAAR domain-containing protein [Selenomonas artemidis]|uniref:PAAR domain-containing protein n=1 Tax=Selenomonas artemidis TaxID=671224 RepID=UPI00205775CD|nr:PAAR domain-containing protein [Selenomonas artemidis]DAF35342.1 MAG TPA: Baseplate wedge protein [Caudoviricetes sp.]